eukprot:3968560-Prymnesium_polylepis.1
MSFIATWKQRWRPMMAELLQLPPSEAQMLDELAALRTAPAPAAAPTAELTDVFAAAPVGPEGVAEDWGAPLLDGTGGVAGSSPSAGGAGGASGVGGAGAAGGVGAAGSSTGGGADVGSAPRAYMHVDMDCFFVSVAVRDMPELVGRPIAVVSGSEPTSEVCSANYAAREPPRRNTSNHQPNGRGL